MQPTKISSIPSLSEKVDVLVITAVKDERDVILRLEDDWREKRDPSGFPYHIRKDPAGLVWALARSLDLGSDLAANVSTRLIGILKPRCLAMAGVCAGWRDKVRLGDVIIAERLFRYDSGKLRAFYKDQVRTEEVFQDIRTYNLEPRWRQSAEDFPPDWVTTINVISRPLGYVSQEVWLLYALNDAESGACPPPREKPERNVFCPDWADVVTRLEKRRLIMLQGGMRLTDGGREYVRELQDRHPDGYPSERRYPKAFVAPMATGNRVLEDLEVFPMIHRYVRKTLAIDMEGAAVAAVSEVEGVEHNLIVKGVQDHADPEKDDRFREYAIEASYRFLAAYLPHQLRAPKRRVPFIIPQHETQSFTGREDELKSLECAILDQRGDRTCTIAGLSGTGGIGKSALAVHFASLFRDRFPDGVIGLRVDNKGLDIIAREFARSAGEIIEPDDERDASTIMQSLFSGRDTLLIFDNAETPDLLRIIPGGR